jgi:glycosyltransferase involved in cell wall biosynthesis
MKNRTNPILTIVVPCFNEFEVLNETTYELTNIIHGEIEANKVSKKSRILFVDDGSSDETWNLILQLMDENEFVTGIKFSRNFGHQNALLAGMETAVSESDCIITIDADLQDDVNAIPKMIDEYHNNYDVVYGVRNNRDTDTWFKSKTAGMFYSLMKHMGVDMVANHADFRLLSQRAVRGLLKYQERNLFLRGAVPLVGYPSTKVYYARKERFAGDSKYPLKKMISFAMNGITSFSTVPIRAIMYLGFGIVLISIIFMIYSIIVHFIGETTRGWSSLMVSIWFLGGVQLIGISAIGEYVGKVFTEVKRRPRYEIESDLFNRKD